MFGYISYHCIMQSYIVGSQKPNEFKYNGGGTDMI